MEGVNHLFHIVIQSPWRNKYLDSLLFDCNEHQAFTISDSSGLQSVVAHVNSKLNDSNSRYEGLLILKTFLSQCPDDIFSSNAFSWASQSLKAIEVKTNLNVEAERQLPFLVLRDIIAASAQFPDVSKQMLSLMSKLIKTLTVDVNKASEDSLKCLQSCMKYYSGQCMNRKGSIEKLLLGLVNSEDDALVEDASNCFILLPLLCGSGGAKGTAMINGVNSNHTAAWNQMLLKVVGSLHVLLNKLFADVNEIKRSLDTLEVLAVPSVEEDNSVMLKQNLSRKYVNLCQYLRSMLKNPLPAAKSIPVEEIMGLICRALAITSASFKDKVSSGVLALLARLPQIHSSSISVLTSLIASSRLNLLPFGSVVVKLLMQSLKWTVSSQEWPSGIKKPYSSVRCSAYYSMSLWLRVTASASCAEEVAEELIGMALLDIVPTRDKLKLTSADKGNRPHGKHNKRRKLEVADSSAADKSSSSHLFGSGLKCALGNGSANSETCCAALEMIASLLQSVGPFLKPSQHKVIQDTTVSILIDIQRSSSSIPNYKQAGEKECFANMILPYQRDFKCRLSILKLLLALVLEPHSHKWPSPLGLAVHIFETGQNDPNVEVATFCVTSARIVERLLHPCAPSLNFPVSLSDMTKVKRSENNTESTQTEAIDTVEVSIQNDISIISSIVNAEDQVPKKKRVSDPQRRPEDNSAKGGNQFQHGSFSSDVIVLSDGEKSPSLKLSLCPLSNELHTSTSDISSTNDLLLVRRVEKVDGNQSVEKAKLNGMPITTLKSKGVQVNSELLEGDEETTMRASSVESHPPLLVLKLPIKNRSATIKDFSQQFGTSDAMVDESAVHIEVNIDDESSDVEIRNLDENSGLETTANFASDDVNNGDDESKEVLVVDQEMLDADSCNDLNHNSTESKEAPPKSPIKVVDGENAPEVEIVELDDKCVDAEKPITKRKKLVELDVDNLSEGEEMVSCFVDVSSDGE